MEAKNIDSILVSEMTQQSPVNEVPVSPVSTHSPVQDTEIEEEITQEEPEKKPEVEDKTSKSSDKPIDEYGNPIEKEKLFTHDEVDHIVKQRLSRVKNSEEIVPPNPQIENANNEQSEDWQKELETFVERTIEKRQTKLSEQQWKQQEQARKVEFESKFTNGMSKYSDFDKVVAGKPITDSMVLATRNLENPAAFIYGAAKMHPQELDRISKINDPYAQAAEIGRLHERMIKTKNIVSNAPRPLEAVTSDMPGKKVSDYPPIDERIRQYAKQKNNR